MKNSHCSYCGHPFAANQPWPRTCANCQKTSYVNPIPVAVVLVPVDNGLLLVRRAIEPRKGQLALPGGFIELGESWQAAGARELWEEVGLTVEPQTIGLFDVHSAPDGTVLIFGLTAPIASAILPTLQPGRETSELAVLSRPEPLAFPLHTLVAQKFFHT